MTDSGDIWQRYDAKVLHIRQLEARVAELESAVATGQHERDHWAGLARQLNKKLQVAAGLAQRLRAAQHEPPLPTPKVVVRTDRTDAEQQQLQSEFDRAREVLGLVLSALTRALDDDDEAVAELGRRLRHHAGGKLLHSITRGSLTLVPLDGRFLVDRAWLERLDVPALRGELDLAAQSGIFAHAEEPASAPAEPSRPQARVPEFAPAQPVLGSRPAQVAISGELEVELEHEQEHEEYDAYTDLPPPPPMPAAQLTMPPPPLLAALPADDSPPPPPIPEVPRRLEDTMRGKIQTPAALTEAFIPNLRIGRLVKTPGGS